MERITRKQQTVHTRPMAVLLPGELARAVGGGIKLPDAPEGILPQATGINVPQ